MKMFGIGIMAVVLIAIVGLLFGAYSLAQQQESIDGFRGEVWNQIDRASQLIGRLESQLQYGVEELDKINQQITNARVGIEAARKTGDLEAALAATNEAQLAVNVLVEAYPQYFDLTEVFTGLQDETAGSFNRIGYARQNLIDAQVLFNKTRITFFPLMPFFERQEVIGAAFDPTTQLAPSTLGGQ
jgi:hypothetical protein